MSNTPSGVVRLTKAQILNGRNHITYEHIEELEGEVPLRPLTGGEIAEIEAVQTRGITVKIAGIDPNNRAALKEKLKQGGDDTQDESIQLGIDLEAITRAESHANALAVMYGMADGETWTIEDVNAISPPSAIEAIANAVFRISKVDKEKMRELKSFRTDE